MFIAHLCDWQLYKKNVQAQYEKQEGQGSTFYVRGDVQKCDRPGCKLMRLIPYPKHFMTVLVDELPDGE